MKQMSIKKIVTLTLLLCCGFTFANAGLVTIEPTGKSFREFFWLLRDLNPAENPGTIRDLARELWGKGRKARQRLTGTDVRIHDTKAAARRVIHKKQREGAATNNPVTANARRYGTARFLQRYQGVVEKELRETFDETESLAKKYDPTKAPKATEGKTVKAKENGYFKKYQKQNIKTVDEASPDLELELHQQRKELLGKQLEASASHMDDYFIEWGNWLDEMEETYYQLEETVQTVIKDDPRADNLIARIEDQILETTYPNPTARYETEQLYDESWDLGQESWDAFHEFQDEVFEPKRKDFFLFKDRQFELFEKYSKLLDHLKEIIKGN